MRLNGRIEMKKAKNRGLVIKSYRYIKSVLVGRKLLLMLIAFLIMLIVSIASSMVPVYLGNIVDSVIAHDFTSFEPIKKYLLVIAGLLLGSQVLIVVRKYIVEDIATRVEKEEFVKMISHILSVDLHTLHKERIGGMNVKMDRSISGVSKLIKLFFVEIMPTIMVTLVAIYIIGTTNMYIALIAIVVLVISVIITWRQILSQKGVRLEIFAVKEDIGAKNSELLMNIEYVKSAGSIPYEIKKVDSIVEELRATEFKHHKYMMSYDVFKMFVEIVGFITVLLFSSKLAIDGDITKGAVLSLAMLYSSVTIPLRSLNRFLDEGYEASILVGELLHMYDKPLDVGLEGTDAPIAESDPIISCQNVSFSVGDKKILNGIDIEIRKGEKIGIAGTSGSGKSTFIKLLLGLNAYYKGTVEVFGNEVRNTDKNLLAKLVSYVPQSPFVVRGTMRENVLYPSEGKYSDTDMYKAIKLANIEGLLDDKIGVKKHIEEQGKNISGGERQRLALSRVFLPNESEMIILDEATSALDAINQESIQEAINSTNKDKTIIAIAHRLRTLQSLDKILVFDRGQIVETGSYEELIAQNGIFKGLVEKETH